MKNKILCGDSLEVLKDFQDNYFDSVVTDPPYGISFMSKSWDYDVPQVELWREVYRVLKPGGHLLSFAGSRTYHRMAVNIEDAGFEIRDMLGWLYGSGFPKSHNIGKAIDKIGANSIGWFGKWLKEWRQENNIPQSKIAKLFPSKTGGLTGCVSNWELGKNIPTLKEYNKIVEHFNLPFKTLEELEREIIGKKNSACFGKEERHTIGASKSVEVEITKGNSKWEGWGTALKPAHEPIVMARKPFNTSVAETPTQEENNEGGIILKNKILCGDSLEVLKDFEDNYFDSVVTDPPYGISFMSKSWDYDVPQVELWKEVYRVLKPGGHILSFAGSRTYHRMAVNIEDAGFEIRDMLGWLYGSGFPKSHNIGKAIDKKPEVLNTKKFKNWLENQINDCKKTKKQINDECGFVATSYTKTDGKDYWSTSFPSLKKWKVMKEVIGINDEYDFIIRNNINKRGFVDATGNLHKGSGNNIKFSGKQLSNNPIEETAKQWEGWGTALKPAHEPIVMARKPFNTSVAENVLTHGTGGINIDECRVGGKEGRFPANIIHDGSEEVLEVFQESSRFFYCAKASKAERNMGLDNFKDEFKAAADFRPNHKEKALEGDSGNPFGRWGKIKNHHPTVKPIKLMEYLVRLVTPKEGIVLEPFAGSGTTLIACKQQGFNYIGIEQEQEYCDIAEARLKGVQVQGELF